MKNNFNVPKIRNDFPNLTRLIDGKQIVYLDSTATSLKPRAVIDAMNNYYQKYSANVFRGIYRMSEEATAAYEAARAQVAKLINATEAEIIFTRNTSESLNLVYYSLAIPNIGKGDEIVTTIMEHHSNFVPWQQLALKSGCRLKIWNVDKLTGMLNYQDLDKLITRRTKLLTITSMSNVLGTIVDIPRVVRICRRLNPGIIILVDAAQSVPHDTVDVKKWDADLIAFSGHKMLGPTGIGVLWGKPEILESLPPFQYGGDMISEVHQNQSLWNKVPHKFEAGTPHIAGAIGMGAAAKYLSDLGMDQVREQEKQITAYALKCLKSVAGINVYGPDKAENRGGVIAFTLNNIHPHDIAQILDEDNVCIRVGFHCAQPLHEYLDIGPTARASFYIYNTMEDVDALINGLEKVRQIFA